jgi:hypothetical protein
MATTDSQAAATKQSGCAFAKPAPPSTSNVDDKRGIALLSSIHTFLALRDSFLGDSFPGLSFVVLPRTLAGFRLLH